MLVYNEHVLFNMHGANIKVKIKSNYEDDKIKSDVVVRTYVSWGHAVAQLVEALRYKPEGGGFDSRWCHWNFSLTYSFRPHYGPGFDSASNRNEYLEYFLRG